MVVEETRASELARSEVSPDGERGRALELNRVVVLGIPAPAEIPIDVMLEVRRHAQLEPVAPVDELLGLRGVVVDAEGLQLALAPTAPAHWIARSPAAQRSLRRLTRP